MIMAVGDEAWVTAARSRGVGAASEATG
jgi:hypothetical protein